MLKLSVLLCVTALCCADIDRLRTTALPWERYENEHHAEARSTQLEHRVPGHSETVQTDYRTNRLSEPVRPALVSCSEFIHFLKS